MSGRELHNLNNLKTMYKGILYLKAMILYASIFLIVDCLAFYFEFPFMVKTQIGFKEVIKISIKTILVGGIFSAFLVSIHLKYLSNLGLNLKKKSSLTLKQQKTITLPVTFNELQEIAFGFKDLKAVVNTKEETISLKSPIEIPFYGEKVSINYSRKKINSPAEITIKSRPKNKLAIIDFGRNYSNVQEIEKRISYSVLSSRNMASTL